MKTQIRAVILDLDGTVYLGKAPVKGAAEFVSSARAAGIKCLFVTNRANRLPEAISIQLCEMGVPCEHGDILTSAQATAHYLEPSRVYAIGEEGLLSPLRERGFTICDTNVKHVIVSYDRSFDFSKLKLACNLIHNGASFIATNPDKGLATDDGLQPGTGAIVAAVEAGCGVSPTVVGKPEPLIFQTAARMLGVRPDEVLAVGDNLDTDIPAGQRAGMPTALILTGISKRRDVPAAQVMPDHVAEDYAELTRIVSELSR